LTQHHIFTIHKRCVFLGLASIFAMERLGKTTISWIKGCCEDAVKQCNYLGLVTTVSKQTLENVIGFSHRTKENFLTLTQLH
jgi:hypothetical protein